MEEGWEGGGLFNLSPREISTANNSSYIKRNEPPGHHEAADTVKGFGLMHQLHYFECVTSKTEKFYNYTRP